MTKAAPEIDVVSRKEFLQDWKQNYGPGQHVTMLGPTQRGKTTLGLQLLSASVSPEHKAVIFAGKPKGRDKTMAEAADKLNMRVVEEWPPGYSYKDRKRNGYVLRPHQGMKDLDKDNANIREQYRKALMSNYASQRPVISFVDEAHHVQNDLRLKSEYEAALMRGAPVNAQWSLIQRGRYMSYLAYDAPEHIFIFYDPDLSNRKRYSEIGGVDPKYLEAVTEELKTYRGKNGNTISEALYVRRSGPELMIVEIA